MNKSILQEAIAEARAIRETAIKNAYKTLEENLTPSIKEMLASKLEEEVGSDEDSAVNEDVNAGFKKVSTPKKTVKEAEEEEPEEEETPNGEEPDGDENGGEADGSHEEPDGDEDPLDEPDESGEGDEPSDDTPIGDLTLGDLRNIIASAVQPLAEPAPEGDLGADMDAGDVEGMGDEDAPLDGEDPDADTDPEANPADNAVSPEEEEDDEIDLSELLKELESEESKDPRGKYTQGGEGNQDHETEHVDECCHEEDPGKGSKKFQKINEENKELKKELAEAYGTINSLRSTLADVNLLNGKLMHATKLLRNGNLSESQKANVIKSLDGAKNLKEVKVIYKTLCESFKSTPNKTTLKEHRSSASKAAGDSTAPKAIVESNFVRRMQQLAGIIE